MYARPPLCILFVTQGVAVVLIAGHHLFVRMAFRAGLGHVRTIDRRLQVVDGPNPMLALVLARSVGLVVAGDAGGHLGVVDASLARSNTNPKKVYCIDHALVTSVSSGILVNSGHLLENFVFTALRRLRPEIYYYKAKTGREVDFILPAANPASGQRMLVQVCESLAEPQTRKRETMALSEAMTELGLTTGTLVTRNEDERIAVGSGTIEVVPVWRFLLDLPESIP